MLKMVASPVAAASYHLGVPLEVFSSLGRQLKTRLSVSIMLICKSPGQSGSGDEAKLGQMITFLRPCIFIV